MSIESCEPDTATSRRNPARTRERLLAAAFEEVYRCGIRGSDLGAILGRAGVTKGALYHHFDSKDALSRAVIQDVVGAITEEKWVQPLRDSDAPLDALIAIVEGTFVTDEDAAGGCPLNNLAQEMSAVDESFHSCVASLFTTWIDVVCEALRRGQQMAQVRAGIDAREQAMFIVAAYEGYMSIGKSLRSGAVLAEGVRTIVQHLESLRRPAS